MRKSLQWALILALAVAVAVLMASGGIAHENDNDDDDGNGGDDGGDNGDTGACPCESQEFLVATFGCVGTTPSMNFAGSSGIGSFMISGADVGADPNSCATLGTSIESVAVDSGCTSAGLVTTPAVALTVTCAGSRSDVVEAQGNMITTLLTFMPSTPLVLQQNSSSIMTLTRSQGRRR